MTETGVNTEQAAPAGHDGTDAAARMLRAIIERIPLGVIVVDAAGNLVFMNEAGRRISGEQPQDDSPVSDQVVAYAIREPVTGRELAAEETPIARAVHGETVEDFEYVFAAPGDRGDRWVRVSAAPFLAPDGSVEGAVAIFADVTEERKIEQRRVNFLAGAMHDLKTPLTAIKGYTQILQRQLARNGALTPETADRSLAQVEATVNRMTGLIGELLDVSRLRLGEKIALNRDHVDLTALAMRMVDQYRELAPGHRFVLEAGGDVTGQWDELQLERVLDNLLSNAVKYSAEGTQVTVAVEQRDSAGQPVAILTVRDEGVGIPPDDLPRIFERFFRAANAKDEASGQGIGLSGARQLIEQHKGTIAADSVLGQGTVFTIRLPAD